MHRRVEGALSEPAGPFPAGTPYRGDDPEHLLWILAALAESAMLVHSKYARTLDRDEKDELWRDYRVVGRLFGLRERDMPRRHRGLRGLHGRALREPGAGRHAAGARAGDRHRAAPAGPAAPAARCSSWSTRSRSACSRRACASSTASPGIRCAPSRCTAARSTSSAWSCPSCPSGCGCCRWRAPPRPGIARQLAVHAAPDPERVVRLQLGAGAAPPARSGRRRAAASA